MSPVGLGASLLSGALGGAGMGPLGILGGAAMSGYQAFQANKAEQDMLAANEADRLKAEEEQARLMAEEKMRMDRQILEQYDVKGIENPRFEGGGMTKTSKPKDGNPTPMQGFRNAMSVDMRAGEMALDHPEFADMFAQMTPEELAILKAKKAEITAQAEGIRGKGVGPAIDMFADLDLSFIKPMRERAGVSKGDLTDWTLDQLGVEGPARTAAKGAAWLKTYEHGGDTHGDPLPNMPMGRETRIGRYGPYEVPVDSPNGSIRQWEPGMFDYLREAAMNSYNPISIIANSDVQQRTDRYGGEGLMGRAGLNNRDKMYANDKNDILPDWAYELAGIKPKMANGGPTDQGEIRPMPDGIDMTVGLSGASNPHEAMIRPDGGMENLLEFIDPTGLTSWDDAYRAYGQMRNDGRYLPNFGEAADMFGAIPLLGKAGKGAKLGAQLLGAAGRGVNMFDTVQDLYSENFAMGGATGPRYEAEGGEMIKHQANDLPRTYGKGGVSRITPTESEIKGPSHAQGGVDMSDNKGARIYSDKLKVDSALMSKLSKL